MDGREGGGPYWEEGGEAGGPYWVDGRDGGGPYWVEGRDGGGPYWDDGGEGGPYDPDGPFPDGGKYPPDGNGAVNGVKSGGHYKHGYDLWRLFSLCFVFFRVQVTLGVTHLHASPIGQPSPWRHSTTQQALAGKEKKKKRKMVGVKVKVSTLYISLRIY